LAAGLVLTGGGARLPGMREAAREATRRQVRVARPLNLDGLVDSIHSEEYSAVIGLADWMQKQMPTRSPSRARGGRSFGSGSPWRERAAQFIRRLLP
jgi:cell division protein FtsA